MSDLNISLILLGIAIIAAVIVYNWRQEKKMRHRISHDFAAPEQDVLVDDFQEKDAFVEQPLADAPMLDEAIVDKPIAEQPLAEEVSKFEATQPVRTPDVEVVERVPVTPNPAREDDVAPVTATQAEPPLAEAVQAVAEDAPQAEVAAEAEATPKETITLPKDVHEKVDLIALLTPSNALNGQDFLAMTQEAFKDMNVRVMAHGLAVDNQWYRINAETNQSDMFRKVTCSLQLADRLGPVPKALVNKYQFLMEAIGSKLEAKLEWQGSGDSAQRAIDLDAFCMNVDQLVSVHLIQGETPIHGTKFKGLAEANDMKLKDGKFYCFDEQQKDLVLFTLVNADNQPFTAESLRLNIVRGATFQIEVPKLVNCEQTFNRVVLVAQQMAGSLGAEIVDDNQRPLGIAHIDKIREQLKMIHTAMVKSEITPGSSISQRLFS